MDTNNKLNTNFKGCFDAICVNGFMTKAENLHTLSQLNKLYIIIIEAKK